MTVGAQQAKIATETVPPVPVNMINFEAKRTPFPDRP